MLFRWFADYASAGLPSSGAWDIKTLSPREREELNVFAISACPPGRHDLSMCPQYESTWRRMLPIVMDVLTEGSREAVVWAEGPVQEGRLLDIFPYMDCTERGHNRLHIEGVTFTDIPGYTHSWVSFQYCRPAFSRMLSNEALDLEYTRLLLMVVDPAQVAGLIGTAFSDIGIRWTVANSALAVTFSSHFEGAHLIGNCHRLEGIINQDGIMRAANDVSAEPPNG